MPKYVLESFYANGSRKSGNDGSTFGEYANDRNAMRFMEPHTDRMFGHGGVVEIILYRYTEIYDRASFKPVRTWQKPVGSIDLETYRIYLMEMQSAGDRSIGDPEAGHYKADELVIQFLMDAGFRDLALAYKRVHKWYA